MTRVPAFVLAVIVAVAVAGGIGVYIAGRGPSSPPIAQARAILKITRRWAHRQGLGYRIIFDPPYYP